MQKVKEGYKMTELGEMPIEWKINSLEQSTDKLTDGSHFSPEPIEFSDYKICTVANMVNNTLDVANSVCISEEDYCNLCKSGCKPELNDVLLSKDGTVGKTLVYLLENYNIVLLSSIAIIRPKMEVLDSFYLKHYISYPKTLQQLINMKTGSAIKRIVLRDIKALKLPIPTLKEQQKISFILSSVDEQIEITDNLIEKTKELKKGLMQKLLTKGIGHSRFKDTEIGKIPEEWEIRSLGEITRYRRGSFPQPYHLPEWYDDLNGMPFVQVFDVDSNFRLKEITKRKISKVATEASVFAEKGTVIITLQGTLGRTAITQYDAYIDRTLLLFTEYLMPIDKLYFMYAINALFDLEKNKADGGVIKTITKETLTKFKIPVPPLKEQHEIASILSSAYEHVDKYELKKEKLQELKKGLMQKLLTGSIRVKV